MPHAMRLNLLRGFAAGGETTGAALALLSCVGSMKCFSGSANTYTALWPRTAFSLGTSSTLPVPLWPSPVNTAMYCLPLTA